MDGNIYVNGHYLKKQARRALNAVAFTSIVSTVLSYVFYTAVSFALPYMETFIGKLLTNSGSSKSYAVAFAENFTGSEELSWFISILSTLLCFFAPFAILAKVIIKTNDESIVSLNGPVMKSFPLVYCAAAMMAGVASLLTGGIFSFLFPDAYGEVISDIVGMYGASTNPSSLILAFIAMCVLAPIAEEFVYRGVAFGYLKKFGTAFAALSSSVFFGLAHSNPEQIAYAVVFGLVLCSVTNKTGNLKTAIMIHSLNNLVGYISSYIIPLFDFGAADALFNIVYNIIMGFLAVVGMIVLFTDKSGEKDTSCIGNKKISIPVTCFFCIGTVFVILFSVITVIAVIL